MWNTRKATDYTKPCKHIKDALHIGGGQCDKCKIERLEKANDDLLKALNNSNEAMEGLINSYKDQQATIQTLAQAATDMFSMYETLTEEGEKIKALAAQYLNTNE